LRTSRPAVPVEGRIGEAESGEFWDT